MDARLFYAPGTGTRYNIQTLRRAGLTPDSPGIFPLLYSPPAHAPDLQLAVDAGEVVGPDDYGNYSVVFAFADIPEAEALARQKPRKLAEFDALFTRLDALKIRPAAAIAEALSKGLTPDPGDVYVLSETQAVTEENRRRRDLVQAAESVEALRAVSVWWPGDRL